MGSYSCPPKMMKYDDSYKFEYSLQRTDAFPPSFFLRRRRQILWQDGHSVQYFSKLPDEIILKILKWLPKKSLGRIAQTSKRFLRLASYESLWERIDMMGKTIFEHNAGVIMSRKPVFLRLAGASILEPSGLGFGIGFDAPQLTYLDLSSLTIGAEPLANLLGMCRNLRKLSLEQLCIPPSTLARMEIFTRTINTLNMTVCSGLQAGPLSQYLSKCNRLNALNLGCIIQRWTSDDLTMIVNSLVKEIEFLSLAGFKDNLLNSHIEVVTRRCPGLIDLDLSDCHNLTGAVMLMLTELKELQHLALSRCYKIQPGSLVSLADMTSLKCLEIFQIFEDSYEDLDMINPNITVNMYLFSSIARPTVGDRRCSIWNKRVRF